MRYLVDSHVVVGAMTVSGRLTPAARAALDDPSNVIFVSAVTPYELEWKKAQGKLSFPDVPDWTRAILAAGFLDLSVTLRHAERAALLPPVHRDPWDRILVAQALVEGLTLITSDRKIVAYGVPTLW